MPAFPRDSCSETADWRCCPRGKRCFGYRRCPCTPQAPKVTAKSPDTSLVPRIAPSATLSKKSAAPYLNFLDLPCSKGNPHFGSRQTRHRPVAMGRIADGPGLSPDAAVEAMRGQPHPTFG